MGSFNLAKRKVRDELILNISPEGRMSVTVSSRHRLGITYLLLDKLWIFPFLPSEVSALSHPSPFQLRDPTVYGAKS